MTSQNVSQLREQALALLRIEREQRSERLGLERKSKKDPVAMQVRITKSELKPRLNPGRQDAMHRTAC